MLIKNATHNSLQQAKAKGIYGDLNEFYQAPTMILIIKT